MCSIRGSTPYGQFAVRTNRYSVPVRLIGKQVRVLLHASHLVIYDRNVEVAWHERLIAKGSFRLELDHYLEALIRKPGAFPGATALDRARCAGRFTPVHDAWWAAGSGPTATPTAPGFRSRCCCWATTSCTKTSSPAWPPLFGPGP